MNQTQTERLLQYLMMNPGIEPLTAWADLGIYRLGARIYDLKKQGHLIETSTKEVKNRFGETCRVAWYVLKEASC